MSRSHWVAAWVVVLCFLTPSSLSAADKKPAGPRPHYETGQAAIEKALAAKVDLDFTKTPLQEVVEYLKDCCKIEVIIDSRALGEVGIETTTPVTKSVHNRPLRSALNLMLKEHGLTWTIQEGVLLVTTPEEADNYMSTKVYDVSDLVVCRGEHDELWDDYDTLIDAIVAALVPTSWDMVGGPGSINGASLGRAKVLIVSHTYHVHCQIADLLAEIREVAKKSPDGPLPRRNASLLPSRKRLALAEGIPGNPAPAPLPPKEAKPGAAVSPPAVGPGVPGVPPGGMMPPGGPKQPPPEDDPFK